MDYLWRNVWASVSAYMPPWEGEEFNNENYIEFLIEVRDRGQVVYQRIIVHKEDLDVPGAYSFILDKMVKELDKALVEGGHRDPYPRSK